jgi:hypothetical protein
LLILSRARKRHERRSEESVRTLKMPRNIRI